MFFLQMSGFPGAGKSTLAKRIAEQTGAVIIDHDVVKSALMLASENLLDNKVTGGISYSIEWALLDSLLSQGHSVILDSPCLYDEMVEKGLELSKRYSVKYKYVECFLDDMNEVNRRLQTRTRMISQIEEVVSEKGFVYTIHNSKKPLEEECLRIDSSQPLEHYIQNVMKYINS